MFEPVSNEFESNSDLNEINHENPKEKCQKLLFNRVQTWLKTTMLNRPWPSKPGPLGSIWQPMPLGHGQRAHGHQRPAQPVRVGWRGDRRLADGEKSVQTEGK
jgi:hypothetical protein